MDGHGWLAGGHPVSLEELLKAREQRALSQRAAILYHSSPLLSLTLVMPGAIKNAPVLRRVLDHGRQAALAVCATRSWGLLGQQSIDDTADLVWMASLTAPLKDLKLAMVALEERHPLGRLWDIDILGADGVPLSRQTLGLPGRRCLICSNDSHHCARSRSHSPHLLMAEIARRIAHYERSHHY